MGILAMKTTSIFKRIFLIVASLYIVSSYLVQRSSSLPLDLSSLETTDKIETQKSVPLNVQLLPASLVVADKIETHNSSVLPLDLSSPLAAGTDEVETYKFAYAFLLAGCNPEKPGYIPSLYGVLIANEFFRTVGSIADVVVMVRMSPHTNATTLPPKEEELFTKAGVIVKYLPKPVVDNFYTAQMDKFRILNLLEYDRVFYLDSDMMPKCNMDYFFTNSVGPNAMFQENVIVPSNIEPAQGGSFMLKPDYNDALHIMDMINERNLLGSTFNVTIGWGQIIQWESMKHHDRTEWDFYGANADQGLLYHWTKHVKKDVTMLFGSRLERWGTKKQGGEVSMRKKTFGWYKFVDGAKRGSPREDFRHFSGKKKPWRFNATADISYDGSIDFQDFMCHQSSTFKNDVQMWYHLFRRMMKRVDLQIDLQKEFPIPDGFPPLGLFSTKKAFEDAKRQKHEPWHA